MKNEDDKYIKQAHGLLSCHIKDLDSYLYDRCPSNIDFDLHYQLADNFVTLIEDESEDIKPLLYQYMFELLHKSNDLKEIEATILNYKLHNMEMNHQLVEEMKFANENEKGIINTRMKKMTSMHKLLDKPKGIMHYMDSNYVHNYGSNKLASDVNIVSGCLHIIEILKNEKVIILTEEMQNCHTIDCILFNVFETDNITTKNQIKTFKTISKTFPNNQLKQLQNVVQLRDGESDKFYDQLFEVPSLLSSVP